MERAAALSLADRTLDRPDAGRVLALGRMGVVILLLAVSPLSLVMLGWQYFDTGGSPVEKFHPAVLLSALLLVLQATAVRANPVSGLIILLERNPRIVVFLAANLFMIGYAAAILKLPVTIFIETFIGAALVFLLMRDLGAARGRLLARAIHALMLANALLGIYEAATGFRLTPLVVNGEELTGEPRATALLGHPLANAALEGGYIVMLALGGGRDLPAGLRAIAFAVALASLAPFGGRAATALTVLSLGTLGARRLWGIARGETFDPRALFAGLAVAPLAVIGLLAAHDLGAFDTLANRLFDDEGSAGTRIEMFELFRYFSAYDLAFGPDPAALMTYVRLHGLEYGIESFIVAFVLNYGLVCTAVFFPPLALFFAALAQACRPGAWLAVGFFLAVSATSISLSSKSPTLSVFTLLLVVLLRPTAPGERGKTGTGSEAHSAGPW